MSLLSLSAASRRRPWAIWTMAWSWLTVRPVLRAMSSSRSARGMTMFRPQQRLAIDNGDRLDLDQVPGDSASTPTRVSAGL